MTAHIPIWSARPQGPDPRAHLWCEDSHGTYVRICDGTSWVNNPGNDSRLGNEPLCMACNDIFAVDSIHGSQAFELKPSPIIASELRAFYEGYPCYNRGTPRSEKGAMLTVPMLTFAKFCAARKETQQERIVNDLFEQNKNPQYIHFRDYYGPLRQAMRQYHWRTGDLAVFDAILPLLPKHPKLADRRVHIQKAGKDYRDFWSAQGFQYIELSRMDIQLADIAIRVNPELGVRTDVGDEYVVKLWFKGPNISRQFRETLSFLMNRAQMLGAWPRSYHMMIWDIRRHRLLPEIRPLTDLRPVYDTKARLFLKIWQSLEP